MEIGSLFVLILGYWQFGGLSVTRLWSSNYFIIPFLLLISQTKGILPETFLN